MHVGLGVMALMASVAPGAAGAATVMTGMLAPVNGWAVFASDGALGPASVIAPGKRMSVSFAIDTGVIAEVLSSLHYRWSYSIMPSDPAAVPFGNDIDGSEICAFNGTGADGCFADGDPTLHSAPARLITNLIVGRKSLSYDLFRPAGFDRCDTSMPDTVCRSQWTIFNDVRFSIASHKPVAYTLRFSDPTAVPEPANWAMLIVGFGCVGALARVRRPKDADLLQVEAA